MPGGKRQQNGKRDAVATIVAIVRAIVATKPKSMGNGRHWCVQKYPPQHPTKDVYQSPIQWFTQLMNEGRVTFPAAWEREALAFSEATNVGIQGARFIVAVRHGVEDGTLKQGFFRNKSGQRVASVAVSADLPPLERQTRATASGKSANRNPSPDPFALAK